MVRKAVRGFTYTWRENREYTRGQKVLWLLTVLLLIGLVGMFWRFALFRAFPEVKFTMGATSEIVGADHYHPGDIVVVTNPEGYCNYGVDTKVTRQIFNSVGGINLNDLEFFAPASPPVCQSPATFFLQLPSELPPGKWQIRFITTYAPNPQKLVSVESVTNEFTVLPHEKMVTP